MRFALKHLAICINVRGEVALRMSGSHSDLNLVCDSLLNNTPFAIHASPCFLIKLNPCGCGLYHQDRNCLASLHGNQKHTDLLRE